MALVIINVLCVSAVAEMNAFLVVEEVITTVANAVVEVE